MCHFSLPSFKGGLDVKLAKIETIAVTSFKSGLMSVTKTSGHPLFIRLDQREDIFKNIQSKVLFVDSDLESMKSFSTFFDLPPETQLTQFCDKASTFPESFTHILEARSQPEAISLALAFIDRLFDLDFNNTIETLHPLAARLIACCANILTVHASNYMTQPFLVRTTILLMGALISESDIQNDQTAIFMRTAINLLNQPLPHSALVLDGLKRSLRSEVYRQQFIDQKGIAILTSLLTSATKLSHTDTLYHILFCAWALTYSFDGKNQLAGLDFTTVLSRLFATTQPEREELVRLLVAIVQQLNPSIGFVENAYDVDLLRYILAFKGKKYVDPDLPKAISDATSGLQTSLKHLSLWDKYVREISSGRLRMSVSHKSELFWKANIERFGENHFSVLTTLVKLLQSDDEETVVVACHDIGEYADRHPLGKVKVEELGAKVQIMILLTHKSAAIQREALRTTQLMLLHGASS